MKQPGFNGMSLYGGFLIRGTIFVHHRSPSRLFFGFVPNLEIPDCWHEALEILIGENDGNPILGGSTWWLITH